MPNNKSQSVMEEVFFTVTLCLTCVVFLIAAVTVASHEESGLTSRSLPIALSISILAYSVVKAFSLFRLAHRHQFRIVRTDGIAAKIILPLSVAMALYVPIVMVFSYVIGTVMVLMFVLWIFDVRDLGFNFAMSVVVGIVANYAFIKTLGMFMPTGWLIQTFQELL